MQRTPHVAGYVLLDKLDKMVKTKIKFHHKLDKMSKPKLFSIHIANFITRNIRFQKDQ